MNLETIQSMWEKDSHIDPDELHTASLVVPTLHAKYYQLFNDLRLLRSKQRRHIKKYIKKDTYTILERLNQRYMRKIPFHIKSERKTQYKDI